MADLKKMFRNPPRGGNARGVPTTGSMVSVRAIDLTLQDNLALGRGGALANSTDATGVDLRNHDRGGVESDTDEKSRQPGRSDGKPHQSMGDPDPTGSGVRELCCGGRRGPFD